MAKGALTKDPGKGIRLSAGVYRDPRTGKTYQSATGALGKDPRTKKKPKELEGAPAVSPQVETAPAPTTTEPEVGFNDAMGRAFEGFANMGQFNPQVEPMPQMPGGDYSQMRQQAEKVAMDSFDRNMQPQFEREQQAFRQRMAEQGVPETSEAYQRQYSDMMAQQNSARQNAMTSAFQAGQGEQAQAYGQSAQNYQLGMAGREQQFNQGLQQYRLPMEQLSAISPFYNTNQQLTFEQQEAERQRQFQQGMAQQQNKWDRSNMKLQYNLANQGRGGGGGGGGGGGSAPAANIWDKYMDQIAMSNFGQTGQSQQSGGGYANGAIQGIASSIPWAISNLMKGGS